MWTPIFANLFFIKTTSTIVLIKFSCVAACQIISYIYLILTINNLFFSNNYIERRSVVPIDKQNGMSFCYRALRIHFQRSFLNTTLALGLSYQLNQASRELYPRGPRRHAWLLERRHVLPRSAPLRQQRGTRAPAFQLRRSLEQKNGKCGEFYRDTCLDILLNFLF